jgi:XTP/dITP diphosphohydrolase
MKKNLLIASGNRHKVQEIQSILEGLPLNIFSTKDLSPSVTEPVEDGSSFAENAKIKAKGYAQHFDGWVLADDSGIVVPKLQGAPGIYSARYAGPDASDQENREKLMKEINALGGKSEAYFVCSICFFRPPSAFEVFESQWHGHVVDYVKGENGFGYDPMFFPSGDSRSAAEWSEQEKNSHSHRAQALCCFKTFLEKSI